MTDAPEAASNAAPDPVAAPSSAPAPQPADTSTGTSAKLSVRDSVMAAMQQVDRTDAAIDGRAPDDREAIQMLRGEQPSKPAPAPAAEPEKPTFTAKRADDGKFTSDKPKAPPPVPATPAAPADDDAPARFTADGKAAWKDAPEPVRNEVRRAIRELETGLEKHRAEAAHMEGLDDLKTAAQAMGLTPNAAIKQLFQANQILSQDLVGGLDFIARKHGRSFHAIASEVLGRDADQNLVAAEHAIAERDTIIGRLQNEVQQFRAERQKADTQTLSERINAFKASNPHMERLAPVMGRLIASGVASDLEDAYQFAANLAGINTAPPPPAVASAPTRDIAAQTRRGSASISGAPSAGSDPRFTPASSVREAAERAMRQTGLM